jgi:hypothetical protein
MSNIYRDIRNKALRRTLENEIKRLNIISESNDIIDIKLEFEEIIEKYIKNEEDLIVLENIVLATNNEILIEGFMDAVKKVTKKAMELASDLVFASFFRGYQIALRKFLRKYNPKYKKFKELTGLVDEFGESLVYEAKASDVFDGLNSITGIIGELNDELKKNSLPELKVISQKKRDVFDYQNFIKLLKTLSLYVKSLGTVNDDEKRSLNEVLLLLLFGNSDTNLVNKIAGKLTSSVKGMTIPCFNEICDNKFIKKYVKKCCVCNSKGNVCKFDELKKQFIKFIKAEVYGSGGSSTSSGSASASGSGSGSASLNDLTKYMNKIISTDKTFVKSPLIDELMKDSKIANFIKSKGGMKKIWTTYFVKYVEKYAQGDILEFISIADYKFYHRVDKTKLFTQLFIAYYPHILNGMTRLAKSGIPQPFYEEYKNDSKFMKLYISFLRSVDKDALQIIGKYISVDKPLYVYTSKNDKATDMALSQEIVKDVKDKKEKELEKNIKKVNKTIKKIIDIIKTDITGGEEYLKRLHEPPEKLFAKILSTNLNKLEKRVTPVFMHSIRKAYDSLIDGNVDDKKLRQAIIDNSNLLASFKIEDFIKQVIDSYISNYISMASGGIIKYL